MTLAQLHDPAIRVHGLEKSYKDLHVLRRVDLDVARGRAACVIGPSGSGKSTLLRTVNRLIEPDRGDVLLDGRSVLRDDPRFQARAVALDSSVAGPVTVSHRSRGGRQTLAKGGRHDRLLGHLVTR